MGSNITTTTNQDFNPAFDLPDIQQDIPFIQSLNQPQVAWRWYQNGYDAEPNDSNFALPHTNYVSHHNGAQYFGYLANNPAERGNYRGENDFFTDMANNALPPGGGVFYIRGGYYNLKYPQQTPPIQNPSYPPGGLTASRHRRDQSHQVRRRRSSELLRQQPQRSDGGPRDQRDRQQPRDLGTQRHHHHL